MYPQAAPSAEGQQRGWRYYYLLQREEEAEPRKDWPQMPSWWAIPAVAAAEEEPVVAADAPSLAVLGRPIVGWESPWADAEEELAEAAVAPRSNNYRIVRMDSTAAWVAAGTPLFKNLYEADGLQILWSGRCRIDERAYRNPVMPPNHLGTGNIKDRVLQ